MRKEFDPAKEVGAADKSAGTSPPFPSIIRIAGIVLVVSGALLLLNALVTMGLAGIPGGGACATFYPVILGIAFIIFGIQILRGAEGTTAWIAFYSIVFGFSPLVSGASAIVESFAAAADGSPEESGPAVLAIVGSVNLVVGVGLETAGILALLGRAEYGAWQRWQKAHRTGDKQ